MLRAVVRRLAEAVKDRSADYLACAAKDHSGLSEIRDFCRKASLRQRLQFLADTSRPLAQRAVAAWFASGINWRYDQQVRGGDIRALAAAYRDFGAGEEFCQSMVLAARKAPEPLVIGPMKRSIGLRRPSGSVRGIRDNGPGSTPGGTR